jgi:hypothetical protein
MSQKNLIPIWIYWVSTVGILSAIVALIGFSLIVWLEISLIDPRNDVIAIAPLAMLAWLVELICGIIISGRSKVIGRILIGLGIILFAMLLLVLKSK